MATRQTNVAELWRAIRDAGGIDAYIEQQLQEHGFAVRRRPTERMSKRELSNYKKELKAEAAERRRLASEAWAAYKANHIVHLGEGVFWNDNWDFDRYDHPRAEERAAENELPTLEKVDDLAETLSMSVGELRWMTYHREAARSLHYVPFTIPKRDGSERHIWAPMPRLKAAQRWILHEVVERLPIHGAAHGFVAGRSIYTNAQQHTDSRLLLKMDIRDFFPTVTQRRVKGVFRRAGYREQIATLLSLLCTESPREIVTHKGETYYIAMGPRCLPQGSPASPALTNTICLRLDRRLTGLAQRFGWRYTRYADDLTFSLPATHGDDPQLGRMMGMVSSIVDDEGFEIRRDKTRVLRGGARQTVTGLVVNGEGQPRVPRKLRRQMRAAIHNLEQGKPYRPDETLDTLMGYAAFIYMSDHELGRRMLDSLKALGEGEVP